MSLTEADLAGTDVVIFLAGLSNDPMAEFSPASELHPQRRGISQPGLHRQARRGAPLHPRVVLLRSTALPRTSSGTRTRRPRTAITYGISKLQAEAGVRHLQDDSFSVIILRKGTVCGTAHG